MKLLSNQINVSKLPILQLKLAYNKIYFNLLSKFLNWLN